MKKHLIAAAVAAGVAVPAMAQVTVSGVIDTGVGSVNNGSTSFTGSVNGLLSTAGIRFTGTEDLGGGLKASFTILQEFTSSSGLYSDRTVIDDQVTTITADEKGSQQDKFSNLNVSLSGAFGTVTLGKQQALARNAGGVGTIIGNVGLTGSNGSTSTRILGDKVDDAFSYTTPNINGFTAQVIRGSRQNNVLVEAAAAAAAANQVLAQLQTTGVGATYSNGPIALGIGSLKREKSASSNSKTFVVGGSYDLKVAKVGVVYSEYDGDDSVAGDANETTVLNVSVPMGDALTLIGAYHDAKVETGANKSSDAVVVGATYAFSKRTTGYAIYSKVSNDDSANYSITGMSAVSTAGRDPKTVAIGIRHSF
jgi:GBP family porin